MTTCNVRGCHDRPYKDGAGKCWHHYYSALPAFEKMLIDAEPDEISALALTAGRMFTPDQAVRVIERAAEIRHDRAIAAVEAICGKPPAGAAANCPGCEQMCHVHPCYASCGAR